MLSCEIFEIFKNTLFYRTPLVAASIVYKMQFWQVLTSLKIFLQCTLLLIFPGRFPFLLCKTPRINYSPMLVIHWNNPLKTCNIIKTIIFNWSPVFNISLCLNNCVNIIYPSFRFAIPPSWLLQIALTGIILGYNQAIPYNHASAVGKFLNWWKREKNHCLLVFLQKDYWKILLIYFEHVKSLVSSW